MTLPIDNARFNIYNYTYDGRTKTNYQRTYSGDSARRRSGGGSFIKNTSWTSPDIATEPNEDNVFIGCVTEFGLILRKFEYKANASLNSVLSRLAELDCVKTDTFKAEFFEIAKKAKKLL